MHETHQWADHGRRWTRSRTHCCVLEAFTGVISSIDVDAKGYLKKSNSSSGVDPSMY